MKRDSGVLLSVTSLPSKYGIGCFDKAAYDFVDWLEKSGQRYWQILPVGASSHSSFDSPYQAYSAFAGNPYMICLEDMVKDGILSQAEVAPVALASTATSGRTMERLRAVLAAIRATDTVVTAARA